MKKSDKNKDFAKQKILQASDTAGVDIELSDRSEINKQLVNRLVAPERATPAAEKHEARQSGKPRRKLALTAIACLCVVIFAAILLFPEEIHYAVLTSLHLYGTVVTAEELQAEAPDITLPILSVNTKIVVYREKDDVTPVFAEITMYYSVDGRTDEITLIIKLVENYRIPFMGSFSDLKETAEIVGTSVSYQVYDEQNYAYAKFSFPPYEYYLMYLSTEPDGILDIIESMF